MRFFEQMLQITMAVGTGLMISHVVFDASEAAMNWGIGLLFAGFGFQVLLALWKVKMREAAKSV